MSTLLTFKRSLTHVNAVDMVFYDASGEYETMTTRPYHHGDLGRALVQHAFDTLLEHDESKWSLRAAARDLGVDPSATYRHFKNKNEVMVAVASAAFSTMSREMSAALVDANTARDRLIALGSSYTRFAVEKPHLFRLATGARGSRGLARVACDMDEGVIEPHELLHAILRELSDAGVLRVTAETAGLSAWSSIHGLAHLVIDGDVPLDEALQLTRDVVEFIIAGICIPERVTS